MPIAKGDVHDFEEGLAASGFSGGAILVAVYTLYAPTRDLRARVPILLDIGGGLLTLAVWIAFFVIAVITLAFTARVTTQALSALALGSFGHLTLLLSQIGARVLPSFEAPALGWSIFIGTVVACICMLRWERRRLRKRRMSKSSVGSFSETSRMNSGAYADALRGIESELARPSVRGGPAGRARWVTEHLEEYIDRWAGFAEACPGKDASDLPGYGYVVAALDVLQREELTRVLPEEAKTLVSQLHNRVREMDGQQLSASVVAELLESARGLRRVVTGASEP